MNMKMEEQDDNTTSNKKGRPKRNAVSSGISDTESMRSMDEPPKDYEVMLQKYEAEVRNHIKIE
jgi:hypothetical protein